jgi:hypothetical protein
MATVSLLGSVAGRSGDCWLLGVCLAVGVTLGSLRLHWLECRCKREALYVTYMRLVQAARMVWGRGVVVWQVGLPVVYRLATALLLMPPALVGRCMPRECPLPQP